MNQYKTQGFDSTWEEMEMWICDGCGKRSEWFAISEGYPDSMAGWVSTYVVKGDFAHTCPDCAKGQAKRKDDAAEQGCPCVADLPKTLGVVERKCFDV